MRDRIVPHVPKPAKPAELVAFGAVVLAIGCLLEPPAGYVIPLAGVVLTLLGVRDGLRKR